MRWMDCRGSLRCILNVSARLARCQFLIKLWLHINICQWGAQSTPGRAAYKYAKFYAKLTNLYIKNVKNLNKLHGNYSTRKEKGAWELGSLHRGWQKCLHNCWQFVGLSGPPPPGQVLQHLFEERKTPRDLVMFFLCNLSTDTFLFVSLHIMKQRTDRFSSEHGGKTPNEGKRICCN